MRPVFLIGGGRDPQALAACHRPFVRAAGDQPIACVIADDGGGPGVSRWTSALEQAGATSIEPVVLAAGRPLRAADVSGAGAIYVAGGLTPLYRELLTEPGENWLGDDVPYCGFSAGAAVAARAAIVGGWRLGELEIGAQDASEELDQLTVLPGLGLVSFAVDVHASQWGTPTRAVHAVAAGLVDEAWAIDEHTCVALTGAQPEVLGSGCAYRLTRAGGEGVLVDVRRSSS